MTRYKATLRIISSTMSLEEISSRIGINPDGGKSIGDRVSQQNPSAGTRSESVWLMESGISESEDLEAHIDKILERLGERGKNVLAQMDNVVTDVFCMLDISSSMLAVNMSSEVIGKLHGLGLSLSFDIYCGEE